MLLGIYFVVALIAGQLTARIRAQERYERLRERRSRALFHLTRALAGARTLDEAVTAALQQADSLFNAQTALLLVGETTELRPHHTGTFCVGEQERAVADWSVQNRREAGRFTDVFPLAEGLHLPMLRADRVVGVFAVRFSLETQGIAPMLRDLVEGFTAQIALLVEREHLRAASEREKFFAESDRLHRTLLDSVSHELKTPIAVLRSAGEKIETDDLKKRTGLIAEIRTATRRLEYLVANLLDQTRLESGGVKPQLDWCDVRDIINAARRGVGDALAGRAFTMEIPHNAPLFMVDAPLMEHVVANLLLNAALHTPAGSPVSVVAGWENDASHQRVFVRVSDRGPGIPVELRENLFQKFRRGATARAGGLGLGLSIVRGFVLAHGGEVIVGENPGGGASFTVYLPHVSHDTVPNDDR
jgi:two-component system sensor histidine kinase KdpD